MSKFNKYLLLFCFVVIYLPLVTAVYAGDSLTHTFAELTPISESIVKEASKIYVETRMIDDLNFKRLNPPIDQGWNPEKEEIEDVLLIPAYDFEGNLLDYYVLGYCGEGEMPDLDEILNSIKPLIDEWMDLPSGQILFNPELGNNYIDFIREYYKDEKNKQLCDEWNNKYNKIFFNRYMHSSVMPFYDKFFKPVNKGVGDLIFGYWICYEKLKQEYPGQSIEFKQFNYYNGNIYNHYIVNGNNILIRYDSIFNPALTIINESEINTETIQIPVDEEKLSFTHKFWDLFLNNDIEGQNTFKEYFIQESLDKYIKQYNLKEEKGIRKDFK